jgi:iron(III) transport system substrate-binding protein
MRSNPIPLSANACHRLPATAIWPAAALLSVVAGCWSSPEGQVVVYCAQDAEFAEPIFADYAAQTGIEVRPKFDVESTKTVGLAEALLAERGRPRCDVFWNNEILHTRRLEKEGLLEAYAAAADARFPASARSPDGAWRGFAARARVLLVNTQLVPEAERPKSILDLRDPKWRGRVAMAKPLFGTTATHAACLFAAWGDARAKEFFTDLKRNDVRILAGNKRVAEAASAGQIAFGLTDTDDALGEIDKARPVAIVYPDQEADGLGTLLIPNTLAILRGAPHPQAARRLVDHLLSPEVERRLAEGPSGQIPLQASVAPPAKLGLPTNLKTMHVDFRAAADRWPAASAALAELFASAE